MYNEIANWIATNVSGILRRHSASIVCSYCVLAACLGAYVSGEWEGEELAGISIFYACVFYSRCAIVSNRINSGIALASGGVVCVCVFFVYIT